MSANEFLSGKFLPSLIDLEYIYNDENKEKIIPYVKKALKDSSKKVAMEARSILNYK